jgi:hypothetical protein
MVPRVQNSTETVRRRSLWWQNRVALDLCCLLLVIVVCLAVGLPRYRLRIDWADEGFLACGAIRVFDGEVPNRDFESLWPPLSYYSCAAIFKVLGPSLGSLRTFGLSIYVLIALLTYAVARNFVAPAFAVAAALPTAFLGMPLYSFSPFAVWQGIAASLAAAFLFFRAALGKRIWLAAPAGVLTSAALALRHEQATYLILTLAGFTILMLLARNSPVARERMRGVFFWWAVAAVATGVMAILCWYAQGALPAMFQQMVVAPFTTYRRTSTVPFPHVDPNASLAVNLLTVFFYLPPVLAGSVLLWVVWRVFRRQFGRPEVIAAFLVAWMLLFYCQVLTRSDTYHLCTTLVPFLILAAYCCQLSWVSTHSKLARFALCFVPSVTISAFIWLTSPEMMANPKDDYFDLNVNRGGIRSPEADWVTNFVRGVQAYVPPDRSILALPYQPLFYFLCERRNPTRWNYLWPGDQTPEDHAALVEQAKRDPPAVIFITDEAAMNGFAPVIMNYIHEQYEHRGDFVQMSVYFPKP